MLENILSEDVSSLNCDDPMRREEDGNMVNDDLEATEYLGGLGADLRSLTNTMKTADWIKVLLKLRKEPNIGVEEALRTVGKDVLEMMKDATDGQFDIEAAEGGVDGAGGTMAVAEEVRLSNKELLKKMSKFTPLRLAYGEREFLRLLESALYISDYTDQIDIFHARGSKNREIVRQVRQICSILTGLVMARDYETGQRLLKDHDFKSLENFFCGCFEIGRRYKTMNPEKMRDSYGKLMYFLMDSRKQHVRDLLEFDCVREVRTVWKVLSKKKNGMELLNDPLLIVATQELYENGATNRSTLEYMKRKKENATKELIRKYGKARSEGGGIGGGFMSSLRFWSSPPPAPTGTIPERLQLNFWNDEDEELYEDEVEMIVYSLKDHFTFMRFNVNPVEKMLEMLKTYFSSPEDSRSSLAIRCNVNGSRLSHDHERQYGYVYQTLLLWIEILKNFHELWLSSDEDLLDASGSDYILADTGQGLHRIKKCPRVRTLMNGILHTVDSKIAALGGGWIGSRSVHLGDHNVPNSFMFIDKYMQVPRIVQPIIMVLENLERFQTFIVKGGEYESVDQLRMTVLGDFFRHGFDGSGADNFYDAGSCIDGRLTSAWNWCNNIEKKSYYPYFLLAGFQGFDGKF